MNVQEAGFVPLIWLGSEVPEDHLSVEDFHASFWRARLDPVAAEQRADYEAAFAEDGAPWQEQYDALYAEIAGIRWQALVVPDEILLCVELAGLQQIPSAERVHALIQSWQSLLKRTLGRLEDSQVRAAEADKPSICCWVVRDTEGLCLLTPMDSSNLEAVLEVKRAELRLAAAQQRQRTRHVYSLVIGFVLALLFLTATSKAGPTQGFLSAAILLPFLIAVPLLLISAWKKWSRNAKE